MPDRLWDRAGFSGREHINADGGQWEQELMELGISRRDLKKLCTLELSHPDMQVK